MNHLKKILKRTKNYQHSIFCLIILLFFLGLESGKAQDSQHVVHRILLTGNTADLPPSTNYFEYLNIKYSLQTEPISFIINGDLIDRNFEVKADSTKINNLLNSFINRSKFRVIILPGDRDWDNSGKNGLKNVKKLEDIIKSRKLENVNWALKNGCPGPTIIDLDENIVLIAINTQWWNHPYKKPIPSDGVCSFSSEEDFMEELEDAIEENEGKNIIVAGHYPIFSTGEYGGKIPFVKHIFPLTDVNKNLYIPLPVIGSLYASYRQNIGSHKDIINKNFDDFRRKVLHLLSEKSNLIYVSGHEHDLQINQLHENFHINSSAGTGLIEIIFYNNGNVVTNKYSFSEDSGFKLISENLLYQEAPANGNSESTDQVKNPGKEEINTEDVMQEKFSFDESFPAIKSNEHCTSETFKIAGPEYRAGSLKRIFFGSHYRNAWTTPVKVPYLNLDTTFNGLLVTKHGGGRQTKSLKFTSGNGNDYVFRSVNKDPSKALNYELRETIVANLLRDQTSMQHPYGAMAADVLLNELEILHAQPKLYVLPNDPKLGPYQEDFSEMLGMLEERPSVKKGEKGFGGADKILKTHKLFRELYNNQNAEIDKEQFAKARLFDILVGDWGKHEDNWKWAVYYEGKKTIIKPIPRDRDHVFSLWDGLFPWLADRKWAKPSGENFGYKINDIRSLTWQSRHLDRFLGNELSKEDWLEAAKYIQLKLSGEIIDRAVKNMPEEVYNESGIEITKKLKVRLKDLDTYAIEYYYLLAKYVDIVGTNKDDYFEVLRLQDGSVSVQVYKNNKNLKEGRKDILFSRTFYPSETKEIRLYGLNGKDVFNISGESKKSIKIRVVGGPDKDLIHDQSTVKSGGKKTLIYEDSPKSEIKTLSEGKRIKSWNKSLFNYERTNFSYNTYLPLPYLGFDQYNGLEFSLGVVLTQQHYRTRDYSSRHTFRTSATTRGNFTVNYTARFHHIIHKWDLEAEGTFANPENFNFFFGLGNETSKDPELFSRDYYLTSYNSYRAGLGLARDFWKRSYFNFKLGFESNEGVSGSNTILAERQNYFGITRLHILESHTELDLDLRDNVGLPTKGMRLFASHTNGLITNDDFSNYGISQAFIEYYATPIATPLTLGLKIGGGESYGALPFYKMFYLGQQNDLRGFIRNRFAGEGRAFFNSELRLQLFEANTPIVPLKIGVKGFYDIGRVYFKKEISNKWHQGYGGGIYIVPLTERFSFTASVGFSEEESALFFIRFGRQF